MDVITRPYLSLFPRISASGAQNSRNQLRLTVASLKRDQSFRAKLEGRLPAAEKLV